MKSALPAFSKELTVSRLNWNVWSLQYLWNKEQDSNDTKRHICIQTRL